MRELNGFLCVISEKPEGLGTAAEVGVVVGILIIGGIVCIVVLVLKRYLGK